jgi:hypothetical protein
MPRRRELPFPLNLFQSRRNKSRLRVRRSRNGRDTEHRSRPEYTIESRGPNGTKRVWPPPADHDNSSRNASFGPESSDATPEPERVRRTREEWVVREGEYYYESVDDSPPDIHGDHRPSDAQPAATHRTPTSRHGEVRPDEDFFESDDEDYIESDDVDYIESDDVDYIESDDVDYIESDDVDYIESDDVSDSEQSAPTVEEDFRTDRQYVHCGHLSRTELLRIRHPSDLSISDHDQQSVRCGSSSRLEQLGIQHQRPTAPARNEWIRPPPTIASRTSRDSRSATANASTGPLPRSNPGTYSRAVQTEAMDQEPNRKPRHDIADPLLVDRPTLTHDSLFRGLRDK